MADIDSVNGECEVPSGCVELIRDAAHENRTTDNIKEIVDELYEEICNLDGYAQFECALVKLWIKRKFYDLRSEINRKIKLGNGSFCRPSKTTIQGTKSVLEVHTTVLDYRIAGTTLGMLKGDELLAVADQEDTVAKGYLFNAALCRELAKKVKGEQRVKDVMTVGAVTNIFNRLRGN